MYKRSMIFIFLSIGLFISSCNKSNRSIIEKELAEGLFKVVEVEGSQMSSEQSALLINSEFYFNFCSVEMNSEWNTEDEVLGDCQLLIGRSSPSVEDHYRYRKIDENTIQIKKIVDPNLSDFIDLTGYYHFTINGRKLTLINTDAQKNSEIYNLKIICQDWNPNSDD